MAKKNREKPREALEQVLLLDKPRLQLPRSNPVFGAKRDEDRPEKG